MKFTKEQLKEMLRLQKEMDDFAKKNNGITDDMDLTQEKYLALMTELYEFGNEVEAFKFWKKNKGKSHQLEELIDALHFLLSIMLDCNIEVEEDFELTDKMIEFLDGKSFNETFIMTTLTVTDGYMTGDFKEVTESAFIGLMAMARKQGFTTDMMFEEYKRKNEINIMRQARNY